MAYPKWLYHKDCGARIVNNAEEESKLGKGWCETPAAFEKKSECDEPVDVQPKPAKEKTEKSPKDK